MSGISINPALTTNATGFFSVTENGLVQGMAFDDPAVRNFLSIGVLNTTALLPMWGGVGISEAIPISPDTATGPAAVMGGLIDRATSVTAGAALSLTGFSVFNQANAWINTPQSPVPLGVSGGSVPFYRLGSGARIAVAIDPALLADDGSIITTQVSWDFTLQRLTTYAAAYPDTTITNAGWSTTAGGTGTFTLSGDISADITAGDVIDIVNVVSTGATTNGYNGAWTVVSVTSSSVVVLLPRASTPGTYASGGKVIGGGGALNVRILKILSTGNKGVVYDPVTGFATWNNNAPMAVILI